MADRAKSSTKRCSKCGSEGPFGKNRAARDGLNGWCKDCASAASGKWRSENLEKAKAICRKSSKEWAQNNPEGRKKQQRKWRKKHVEKRSTYARQWNRNNPEKARAYSRRSAKRFPEKIQARSAMRRAILKGILVPENCANCGIPPKVVNGHQRIHGHHHLGYDKRHHLDIQWLCSKCHGQENAISTI